MSPVMVVRKGAPLKKDGAGAGKGAEGLAGRDWVWVGLALACTWLLLTGLHRLFSGNPAPLPSVPPVDAEAAAQTPPESSVSAPGDELPPRVILMHDEAVRATVEGLRQHAKECPGAPDVLSDDQIRAIEREGMLIL